MHGPMGISTLRCSRITRTKSGSARPSDGVYLFDPETATSRPVKRLKNDNVTSIIEDHLGQIWTCGWWGVTVFDIHVKTYKDFNINNRSFENKAWSLGEDELGRIWVTMDTAIGIIDPVKGTFQELKQTKNFKQPTHEVFRDDEGRMWIGSLDGLRIVDLKKQTITTVTPKEGLCAPDVYTIYKYKGSIYTVQAMV